MDHLDETSQLFMEQVDFYEKKIYEQNQLIEISKALNSNLNLYLLLESIIDICLTKSLGMQVGIFLVPEIDQKDFVLYRHSVGFNVNNHSKYIILRNSNVYKLLEQLQRPIILNKLIKLYYQDTNKELDAEIKALKKLNENLLIIPMYYQKKINGIIVIGLNENNLDISMSRSEITFLSNLSSIASIAVNNAHLYKLATIDMMTKLHIHHYFKVILSELFEESKKKFCLILIDIDHFKKFNDTHGHQVGDMVLKAVAQVLLTHSREQDLKCRYGGEEFVVITYETDLRDGKSIAEKLRKKVEELTVINTFVSEDHPHRELKVTISLGVAEYSHLIDFIPDHLIKRCDDALYKAKQNGKNRVEFSN